MYFKRLNETRWRGPGTVLGQDGQQILVKYGSTYVRVHPCRICLERKSISNPGESDSSKKDSENHHDDNSRNNVVM